MLLLTLSGVISSCTILNYRSIILWLGLYINYIFVDFALWLLNGSSMSAVASGPTWHVLVHLPEDRIDLHLRRFDYLISYSLLHEVDLALADDLHQLVLERDRELAASWCSSSARAGSSFQILDAFHSTSLDNSRIRIVFCTWIYQKRVIFA